MSNILKALQEVYNRNVNEVAEPKSPAEKNFKDKHVVDVKADAAGNGDDFFTGKNVGKDKTRRADYKDGEDEEVYEAKMENSEILSAARKLAKNGKDAKTRSFGQGLVDFYAKNDSFTPDQVAGLQNIMKNAGFQMAEDLDERELSDTEMKKKEEIVKSMKGDTKSLKAKYGDDWKSVMYATATKLAKNEGVEINEKVEVSQARFERVHGRKASGRGALWAFTSKKSGNVRYDNEDEVLRLSGMMNYTDAAQKAKEWAKERGHSVIYVMESLDEAKEATGALKGVCWKDYTAVGMKTKNGKKVPNCVPTNEENEIDESTLSPEKQIQGTNMKKVRSFKNDKNNRAADIFVYTNVNSDELEYFVRHYEKGKIVEPNPDPFYPSLKPASASAKNYVDNVDTRNKRRKRVNEAYPFDSYGLPQEDDYEDEYDTSNEYELALTDALLLSIQSKLDFLVENTDSINSLHIGSMNNSLFEVRNILSSVCTYCDSHVTESTEEVDEEMALIEEFIDEEMAEKNLDPVGKEDDDIDNDGDSDSSDEYLKNRRKVISKNIKESKTSPLKAKQYMKTYHLKGDYYLGTYLDRDASYEIVKKEVDVPDTDTKTKAYRSVGIVQTGSDDTLPNAKKKAMEMLSKIRG